MKTKVLLAIVLVAALSGVAYVGQQAEPCGTRMARAAEKFLTALTPPQRAKATFAFEDAERLNWHFIPLQDRTRQPTRKGLPLGDLTPDQKAAALDLLKAGTSPSGNDQATTIMSLESILHDLEKGGNIVRDPGWYFFAVFGQPSSTGRWGWRVEGHHLSLNFTVDGGRLIASTPAFFGANPATVMAGPRKGLRNLAEAEDLARELFRSLDADQRKSAQQDRHFPEVAGRTSAPQPAEPRGLAAAHMTAPQRDLLLKLLRSYAERMPADVADAEMTAIREHGIGQVHFAFAGGTQPGEGHTYRIQGPTFVVEFLNVQADSRHHPANHIHSVWRSLPGDFGLIVKSK